MKLVSKFIDNIKNFDKTNKTGIVNMLIKPIGIIVGILYTPLLLTYFSDEKYGLWATLLSIITWINYFDMGLGNGLRNVLSNEISNKKYDDANKSVTTAYIILSVIGFAIYLILIILTFVIDWKSLLNTSISITPTLLIFFTFVCLNFVLSISNTLLYSLQKSILVSIRGYIAQIINLLGLIVLNKICPGNLEMMAILFGSSTMIMYIVTFISVIYKNKYLKPRIKSFSFEKAKTINSLGIQFFIIQVCCLILFTTDNIIVSHFFGAEAVTPFSIVDKLFSTVYSFFAAFLVPFWAKSSIEFSKRNVEWIKKSIKFSIKVCLCFCFGYLLLNIFINQILFVWLGKKMILPTNLSLIMFLYYCIYSILSIECQFINGSGKIKVQMYIYIFAAIANIPLSIWLGVNMKMNSTGVRLATLFLLIIEVVVLGFNLKHIIKESKETELNCC